MKIANLTLLITILVLLSTSCEKNNNDEPKIDKTDSIIDSRDGNIYKTITIGNQTWMAENLRYLPTVTTKTSKSSSNPLYYVYDYNGTDVSAAKVTTNFKVYGVLYNWAAAKVSCPTGWHLPSESEWSELINYLGGVTMATDKLKATTNWINSTSSANNTSGFTALPGGALNEDNVFSYIGRGGIWWTSTSNDTYNAYHVDIFSEDSKIYVQSFYKSIAVSVRCIKDQY